MPTILADTTPAYALEVFARWACGVWAINSIQLASRQQADQLQGVTKSGPNPGANADDRGLYLYNPVTVPLAPAH
jgi:hypothetical protein